MTQLIVFRGLQGIGAGALMPLADGVFIVSLICIVIALITGLFMGSARLKREEKKCLSHTGAAPEKLGSV